MQFPKKFNKVFSFRMEDIDFMKIFNLRVCDHKNQKPENSCLSYMFVIVFACGEV